MIRFTSSSWPAAAFLAMGLTAACTQELPPRTAIEFMEQPAVLQAVLLKCNQMQNSAARDAECRNAREAVDRLAAADQAREQAAAQSEFERAREARRIEDERKQEREAAHERVDPYSLPLVKDAGPEPAQSTAAMAPEPKPSN